MHEEMGRAYWGFLFGLLTNGSGVGSHSLNALENSLNFTEFAIFCLGTTHGLSP